MKDRSSFFISLVSWFVGFLITSPFHAQENQPLHGIFDFEDQQREYIYFAPTGLDENAPLVVVLHGFTSSAEKIMNYSRFNRLASKHQFAVLYPQGSKDEKGNTFWNVAYDFHKNTTVNDIDFLISLIKTIQEDHKLSTENTFLTGMSNGGEMTYLLGCMYPDMFKAIAPVAGTMFINFFDRCLSVTDIPVLAIFGTKDEVTRYDGDPENEDGWGVYKSILDIINFWAESIHYDKKSLFALKDLDTTDGSQVIKTRYYNSNNGHQVLYFKVVNGGHDWPGAWGNKDMDASKEIWTFFNSYK
jgi:polyhydroxybutyrate depolymerase